MLLEQSLQNILIVLYLWHQLCLDDLVSSCVYEWNRKGTLD